MEIQIEAAKPENCYLKKPLAKWMVNKEQYRSKLDEEICRRNTAVEDVDGRVAGLERAMLKARKHATVEAASHDHGATADCKELIRQRRSLQASDVLAKKAVAKNIQKLQRHILRKEKQHKISRILSEFRGLKEIANIKGTDDRTSVNARNDKDGNLVADEQGIADVFAEFYGELYKKAQATAAHEAVSETRPSPDAQCPHPFTTVELRGALKAMKPGKAGDEGGIIAEMLKDGSDALLEETRLISTRFCICKAHRQTLGDIQ